MASPYRERDARPDVLVYQPPAPDAIVRRSIFALGACALAGLGAAVLLGPAIATLACGVLAGASVGVLVLRLLVRWWSSPRAWRREEVDLDRGGRAGDHLVLAATGGDPSGVVRTAQTDAIEDGDLAFTVRTFQASPLVLPLSAAPLVLGALGWWVLALGFAIVWALFLPVLWVISQVSQELAGYALLRVGPRGITVERGAEHDHVSWEALRAFRLRGGRLELEWRATDGEEERTESVTLWGVGPRGLEAKLAFELLRARGV